MMSSTYFENPSSTYKTPYTDACKTYYTLPVYTTVFLKMNPRLLNINQNISL
jgi:hypothetical protein